VAEWAAADAPRWPDASGPTQSGTPRPGGPADGELSSGVGLATPPGGQPGPTTEPPASPPPAPPRLPRQERTRGDLLGPDGPPVSSRPPTPPPSPHRPGPAAVPGDEHFVPPEPPPLPRIGLSSIVGLMLLVVGVVLLAVPSLLSGAGGLAGLGIVPGLLAMTAGLGWLVFGLRRPSERDGGGPDADGEV